MGFLLASYLDFSHLNANVGINQKHHRVSNRAVWSARQRSRMLLAELASAFASEGPLVFGIDATIERRWEPKIKARG